MTGYLQTTSLWYQRLYLYCQQTSSHSVALTFRKWVSVLEKSVDLFYIVGDVLLSIIATMLLVAIGEEVFPVLANDYGSSVLALHDRYVVEARREHKAKLPKEAEPPKPCSPAEPGNESVECC